ncbi:helix-turn-helix transcriptional regulator [Subtercola endophyticus]|uniref:helix-turn-helix transcriptional regulator n=1 Tax=Subtercola endophyticus TaxID=2895559 RepID=UPI001E29F7BD|nr:helix-turn-helix transcriptional regulator [Subtercola endophyticus]UFS59622.1 helix-turn-helix transcriptional regulator [Subtercola endophyticus]
MPADSPLTAKIAPLLRVAEATAHEGRTDAATNAFAELALLSLRRGDWNQAEVFAARATELAQLAPTGPAAPAALLASALVPAGRGELSTAFGALDAVKGLPVGASPTIVEPLALHIQLIVLIGLNDWFELGRLTERSEGTPVTRYFQRNEWLALRLLAAWHLNDVVLSDAILAEWGDTLDVDSDPYFHTFRGLLLDRDGRHVEAIAAIRRSIELVGPAEDPLGRTWIRLVAGSALTRRGDTPEEGLGLYREAREELDRLGARVFVARCDSIMATSLRRLGASVAQNPLSALSPHQHRVATLVADGHTNREIGQVLGVSTKTIDFHVGNILARLSLPSRRHIRDLLHRSHQ